MRILISYDGSDQADAALKGLRKAGLPREAEAIVISIADSLAAPEKREGSLLSVEAVEKAAAKARQASEMIRNDFPNWKLRVNLAVGSAARVILKKAYEWKADLIVVGSFRESRFGRNIFGAVAPRLAAGADCAIRVARGPGKKAEIEMEDDAEHRLLICVDESSTSQATVQAVASRLWPKGTEARLFTAVNPYDYSLVPLLEQKIDRVKTMHRALANELEYTPVFTSSVIKEGEPAHLILKEAEEWRPTSIFIGTQGKGRFHSLLSGSLSHEIVARAQCPVELVKRSDLRSSLSSLLRLPEAILDRP